MPTNMSETAIHLFTHTYIHTYHTYHTFRVNFDEDGQGEGGYAKEMSEEYKKKEVALYNHKFC